LNVKARLDVTGERPVTPALCLAARRPVSEPPAVFPRWQKGESCDVGGNF